MQNVAKILLSACIWFVGIGEIYSQKIVPLKYRNNESFTYEETIKIYEKLDAIHADASLLKWGNTDAGEPLYTFVVNTDEIFDPETIRQSNKSILMIMNGIHPGEPDGIDASMIWLDDLLNKRNLNDLLENVILVVIPVYNVDGMLNRGCCTRANQNGPSEYGFRGNAQNLDLNRDFIKQESQNAISFAEIFRKFDPDVFIDTHVSNGADYPYTFSLLYSSGERLPEPIRSFYLNEMVPTLYKKMGDRKWEMIPYVNIFNAPPDNGFSAFYDSPRYSSGYTSMFGTLSFTAETHMLKPYPKRVEATIDFLDVVTNFTNKNSRKIQLYRNFFKDNLKKQSTIPLRYEIREDTMSMLKFKTYAYRYEKSKVTGQSQLYFDTNTVIEKYIPYKSSFKVSYSGVKPEYFVIPYAYTKIAKKLENAGVELQTLMMDSLMDLEAWYLPNVEFKGMYEGRPFYHKKDTNVVKVQTKIRIPKGSFIVKTGSDLDPFIMNALHPLSDDSYLVWGYFASSFDQKEHFSAYIFDAYAQKLLEEDNDLRKEFEAKKDKDKEFAKNHYAQLNFIYKKSIFAEKTINMYPIYFKY